MSSVAPSASHLSDVLTHGENTLSVARSVERRTPSFDISRATDASYYGIYGAEFVAHHNANKPADEPLLSLRTHQDMDSNQFFSIVELMFIFGGYMTRKSALSTWRNLRNGRTPKEVNDFLDSSDERSQVVIRTSEPPAYVRTIGRTDYCTLADFLDHILDHLTGPVAEAIRFARRKTSTMVSTGSSMAIALTEQNALAIGEAPEEVRQA